MPSAKKFRYALALAALLGIVYVFLLPANKALYDILLFPVPDPRTPDVQKQFDQLQSIGVKKKGVSFNSKNGRTLHGWLLELPNTKRVFLYSHAKGNNIFGKIHIARNLLLCGGSVLMYDYEGYGLSEGRASIQNACNDGIAAYDYLVQHEGRRPEDIIAFGESMGAGITTELTKHRKVAGVILHSGFTSLMRAGRETLPWLCLYPDWTFPHQILNSIEVFEKPHPPLLLIHGQKDTVTNVKNSEDLFAHAIPPKMLVVLPEVGHCSFGKSDEGINAIREFISQNKL